MFQILESWGKNEFWSDEIMLSCLGASAKGSSF